MLCAWENMHEVRPSRLAATKKVEASLVLSDRDAIAYADPSPRAEYVMNGFLPNTSDSCPTRFTDMKVKNESKPRRYP